MPRLTISTDNLKLEVDNGVRLMQVCRDNVTSIPFGCREGNCGTCLIMVEEHPENLSPIGKKERDLLESIAGQPGERLACQCQVLGDVTVALAE